MRRTTLTLTPIFILFASLFLGGLSRVAPPALAEPTPPVTVSFSEIRVAQPGENNEDYVELAGAPSTSLDGITYLVIGDNDFGPGGSGYIEQTIDLSGYSIPASGYFVIASGAYTLGTPDLLTPLQLEEDDNTTHLLVTAFTGNGGDDLDTNDDGTLDVVPWTNMLDSLVLVKEGLPPSTTEYFYNFFGNIAGLWFGGYTWYDGPSSPWHAFRCGDTWRVASPLLGWDDTPGAANACGVNVVINELDADTPGADMLEFVELYDGGVGVTYLNGLVLVLYNGSNDLSYAAFDLDGFNTNTDGYFVLGNAAVVPTPPIVFAGNLLQNGQDAAALYVGDATSFPNNTLVSLANIVDALVYDTNDADDAGLLPLLNGGQPQVNEDGRANGANDSIQRCPNGEGGQRNTSTYQTWPPSPRAANVCEDPPTARPIHDIQGAAHRSPYVGQRVKTTGYVTVLAPNGFWIEEGDAQEDADPATSEGLFVFQNAAPAVALGDYVVITATVSEYQPGGASTNNLSITELAGPVVEVASSGNELPSPVLIGSGLIPPNQIIENDAEGDVEVPPAVFDIDEDGIDFWESLEGMRLVVTEPVVVGPTNSYGEIPVVADQGEHAGAFTFNGGLLLASDDGNPERLILDDLLMPLPALTVGDLITPTVTGVLDYNFGNYKLLVTAMGAVEEGEAESFTVKAPHTVDLTVATYNVLNLDPLDAHLTAVAQDIVNNLRSPDILGVQEIQDNNGAVGDGIVNAIDTWNALITAIWNAGSVHYEYRDIIPLYNQDGGEPNGNIRCGFLFRPDRVTFVDIPPGQGVNLPITPVTVTMGIDGPELSLSPGRIDPMNPAFTDSRKPLVGEFIAFGEKVFVIVNHFNSKGGDTPLFGRVQPPVLASEAQRIAQATVVNGFVKDILALDPQAKVIVLGDLNDFPWSAPIQTLLGTQLSDMSEYVHPASRYSYIYDGNSQALDYILASSAIVDMAFHIDVVHINADWPAGVRATDHDPVYLRVIFYGNEYYLPVMSSPPD